MSELQHYGILGMKWGVRRYQNPDGSLTEAGQKRYQRDVDKNMQKKAKDRVDNDDLKDPHRWVEEDLNRSKTIADNSRNALTAVRDIERVTRSNNKKRLDLTGMSDAEMRAAINRELLEKQYNDLFNSDNISRGRQQVSKILDVGGNVLAVTSSALAVALAIKQLRGS